MRRTIELATCAREELLDITPQVENVVRDCGIEEGLVSVYVQGATAGILVQENWDNSVPKDMVHLLQQMVPWGVWEHDQQDGNGDAHLKSGLIGPSETVPLIGGRLGLSTWQGLFLCEFDGPRRRRKVVCTLLADRMP